MVVDVIDSKQTWLIRGHVQNMAGGGMCPVTIRHTVGSPGQALMEQLGVQQGGVGERRRQRGTPDVMDSDGTHWSYSAVHGRNTHKNHQHVSK